MNLRYYIPFVASPIISFIALSATAQSNPIDSLVGSFVRYQSQAPQEKLFVHTDRTFYLAGETVWFKLYDIDGNTNRPLNLSGIAYIELLDKDRHPVLQEKVEMKNGSGDGNLNIPLSVPSGEFLFRAYTSWMRNFSPDFYYMQPLTILNTLNDSTADTDVTAHSGGMALPAIGLFPEGGNLVNGLASEIAVTTTDSLGHPAACDGVIIDRQKDTVARFHTGISGIGKFTFTPGGGQFNAVAEVDHLMITRPLPAAFDQGYVMHLEDSAGDRIHITVHAAGPVTSPDVYLFAHTRGIVRIVRMNYLVNGQASFYLDKDSLGDGISHLSIFNGARIPVCERLYFKQPKHILKIGIDSLTSFQTRSRLSIALSTTDHHGNPVPADLSMSVFRLDALQPVPADNILGWLLLSSDLKGKIDFPRGKDWITDPAAAGALDDLMLTQGWSRFRWEDIFTPKPAFDFLPESNGPVISAKLIDKKTGEPPAPQIAYLSVPGQHFRLLTALSLPDGTLDFHPDNFYGSRSLIVQTNAGADSNRIEISSPWSDRFAPYPLTAPAFSTAMSDQLLQRSIDAQAENAYLARRKHRVDTEAEDTTVFYGVPDLTYNLDDYVRFETMAEVIHEYVNNVHVRQRSGRAYFRVRNELFNQFFEDDPLLLIDGIPVFSPDKMIGIDPAKVKTIEVVSHRYILGPSITDGIISFRSYDGEMAGYELDPNAVALQYSGLEQHREFYTPVYGPGSRGQPSIPDFREELLWAPDILTGRKGNQTVPVYTSDLTGNFAVMVEGITADGLAGYSIRTFSVAQ